MPSSNTTFNFCLQCFIIFIIEVFHILGLVIVLKGGSVFFCWGYNEWNCFSDSFCYCCCYTENWTKDFHIELHPKTFSFLTLRVTKLPQLGLNLCPPASGFQNPGITGKCYHSRLAIFFLSEFIIDIGEKWCFLCVGFVSC